MENYELEIFGSVQVSPNEFNIVGKFRGAVVFARYLPQQRAIDFYLIEQKTAASLVGLMMKGIDEEDAKCEPLTDMAAQLMAQEVAAWAAANISSAPTSKIIMPDFGGRK